MEYHVQPPLESIEEHKVWVYFLVKTMKIMFNLQYPYWRVLTLFALCIYACVILASVSFNTNSI